MVGRRRHGVDDLDIQHAVTHSPAIEDAGKDPIDGSSLPQIERATCPNSLALVDRRGEIVIHALALPSSLTHQTND